MIFLVFGFWIFESCWFWIFLYNKLNGYGEVHNTENGYEYWGNWENDQQMGQGREEWSGGSSYEGNYEYGNK